VQKWLGQKKIFFDKNIHNSLLIDIQMFVLQKCKWKHDVTVEK
jgi:hypothetical protein